MFKIMQKTEMPEIGGNDNYPKNQPRKNTTILNEILKEGIKILIQKRGSKKTEKTEADIGSFGKDINSLCLSFLKSISVFFYRIFKSIIPIIFRKEGRKYAISVLCHYFRHLLSNNRKSINLI